MASLFSPVSADHQSLHGGKVEGAQVGGKPRSPPLQVSARPVLFPSPDRDHYCVSYTNVILESEAALTVFFRESPRSRDPCWRPGSPWPASSCCPLSSASLCPGSDSAPASPASPASGSAPAEVSWQLLRASLLNDCLETKCWQSISLDFYVTFYRQLLNFDVFRFCCWCSECCWGSCWCWSWWWYWQCWLCLWCDTSDLCWHRV